MIPENYYHLPTLRKVRRKMRKAIASIGIGREIGAARAFVIYRDSKGVNIMKSRRYKNRLLLAEGL